MSEGEKLKTDLELLAFQDIPVSTAGLPRSAGDGCVQTTSGELAIEEGVDLGLLLTGVKFALGVVGEFLGLDGLVGGSGRLGALLGYRLSVLREENDLVSEIERKRGGGGRDGRTWASYHWRKGVASIWMMALFTRVFVRTNSLFDAL